MIFPVKLPALPTASSSAGSAAEPSAIIQARSCLYDTTALTTPSVPSRDLLTAAEQSAHVIPSTSRTILTRPSSAHGATWGNAVMNATRITTIRDMYFDIYSPALVKRLLRRDPSRKTAGLFC